MKVKICPEQKEKTGDLFGIFFEDLNHAADGGLYAELVQNRSFEFCDIDHPSYHGLTAWEPLHADQPVQLRIMTGNAVSEKNPHYLSMDVQEPGEDYGIWNIGFGEGIPLKKGAVYNFCCYAKREQDRKEPIEVSLRGKDGSIYAKQEFYLEKDWKKISGQFCSAVTDSAARLAVTAKGRGKVYLDFVSLFPQDTFKGRKNGVRKDLAELLAAMHPKFMRFPGGCLIHDGALDPDARDAFYRWKNTVGPVEQRPARRNSWGYNQTLGLGFYELFQLSEDIGAKPLPVVNGGWDPHHKRAVPMDEIQPFIDDALDLIEFANGSTDTKWGAVRTEMGHPEPFGMEYLGIGNEEVGAEFFERFEVICRAVREKYPEIKIIGTASPFAAGSEFERGWDSAVKNKVDLVDEHYYMSPEWFLANHHRYDSYDRSGPGVFLGEYASWGNTWYNALVEASYMIGMEKNVPAVRLACYAPMLAHTDYVNWKPDMIWYDNHRACGSANYEVQKLFMNHLGRWELATVAEEAPQAVKKSEDQITGSILLDGNESEVEYTRICLKNEDTGETTKFADCRVGAGGPAELLTEVQTENYTLTFEAKEKQGFRGFRIYFGWQDEDNNFMWSVGGWQNQDISIFEKIKGRSSELMQALFTVEKEKSYTFCLKVRGRKVEAWADEKKYLDPVSKPVVEEPIYLSVQEKEDGKLIIKGVNVQKQPCSVTFNCPDAEDETPVSADITYLGDYEETAENSLEQPHAIIPQKKTAILPGKREFTYCFPENSITILEI